MTDATAQAGAAHVSDQEFDEKVLKSDKPVMVDFYADWCGPCKLAAPILDELSSSQDKVQVIKMNVDADPDTARKFNVMSIPTVILFEKGKEVTRQVGFSGKQGYLKLIDSIKE